MATAPDDRKDLIQIRRDTAADWAAVDPVLAYGEPGWDTDNEILKIGDGVTSWSGLAPVGSPGLLGVAVEDEGSGVTNATTLDFVGSGVTAADAGGGTVTVTVPGGGSSSAAALGFIDATDYGCTGDARKVTDAVTTASDATVTSATAAFVAGDVGKVVNISKVRVFMDAAINAADTTLTSATAAFTAADVGKSIHIDGAGATAFSLTTTIASYTSATEVELTAAAATSVSARAGLIKTLHHTTVASVSNGTTIELTAAPTFTLSGASLVVGTDDMTNAQTAATAALAANKPLYFPPGEYMLVMSNADPAVVAATDPDVTLRVLGADRSATILHAIHSDMPASSGYDSLFTAGVNVDSHFSDFTVRYTGIWGDNIKTANGPYLITHIVTAGAGEGTYECTIERVDADNIGSVFYGLSGHSDNRRRLTFIDCHIVTYNLSVHFFAGSGGTLADVVFTARDTWFETTNVTTTTATDTMYNTHVLYVHMNASVDMFGCTTKASSAATGLFHLHANGGGSETPAFYRVTNHTLLGEAQAGFRVGSVTGTAAVLTNVVSIEGVSVAQANENTTVIRPFVRGGDIVSSVGGQRIAIIHADWQADSTQATAFTTTAGADLLILGGRFSLPLTNSSNDIGLITGAATKARVVGATIEGGNDGSPEQPQYAIRASAGAYLTMDACVFKGRFRSSCVEVTGTTAGTGAHITNCVNETVTPLVRTPTGTTPKITGSGNTTEQTGGEPIIQTGGWAQIVPRAGQDPTPIASATSISPPWNYDTHTVSGSTAITTIIKGGSVARNGTHGGLLYLVGAASATWTLGTSGNIADVAGPVNEGDVITLRWDNVALKWRVATTTAPTLAANAAITAVSGTIRNDAKTVTLTADNSYTLTSAPTVADGQDGQVLRIVNVDTTDTITIQDQGTLASSNLRLTANTVAIAPRQSVELTYSATVGDWVQTGALVTVI